jgi:phosphoglucosamine mutase
VGRLFGTDGVRGVAGVDLTAELAMRLAATAVGVLAPAAGSQRPLVIVGRDPRPSGDFLETAVTAGLLAAGADVLRLGVVPTPAVAAATAVSPSGDRVPAFGIMISASHNPMPDNGLKFFGPGGGKLDGGSEDAIEAGLAVATASPVTGAAIGRVDGHLDGAVEWYVHRLIATLPKRLEGLRVVVDCANGAAAAAAPAAYRAAGADVVVINDATDGYRINEGCGATQLEPLQEAVRAYGATAGLAHDGDADRCLAVAAGGEVVDGDQILGVLAVALKEHGALRHDAVAATVMSNLGFHRAMATNGIRVAETPVGDRHVLERMRVDDLALGGEQSGHIVLGDYATTGDGILTGLHLLSRIAETDRGLADLASIVQRMPQVLVNVPVADKTAALGVLEPLASRAAAALGDAGRVLVRASGTEPLVRVMVEADTEPRAREVAETLAAAVRAD